MCDSPDIQAPPPPPAPPPTLEQLAPKSKASSESATRKKRRGLSKYKINTTGNASRKSVKLGGIPKKAGV